MNEEDLFGELILPNLLEINKAKRLLQYITSNSNSYLKLVKIREKNNHDNETIIINLGIEIPQKVKVDVRKEETIAIVFRADDILAPQVLMLREDFPSTPHQNLQSTIYPKSLCLSEEPYDTIKLTWTPSFFLSQIHNWLKKTALTKLHDVNQALEPFIIGTPYNLIIPNDFNLDKPSLIDISMRPDGSNITFFLNSKIQQQKVDFVAIGIRIPETEHGVIRYTPNNLSKLVSMFSEINYDLNSELSHILREIILDEKHKTMLDKKIFLFFSVPLKRSKTSDVERVDYYAFISGATLRTFGITYGICDDIPDSPFKLPGLLLGQKNEIGDTEKIDLCQIRIQFSLDSESAAFCNNVPFFTESIVAIGLGALGSQIVNNLIRSGFGKWKLIDDDLFLPHNSARHILPCSCSGFLKAGICKDMLNQIIEDSLIDEALCINILNIDQQEKLMPVLKEQKFIFDFSASVAVSRYLANNADFARSISAYLTPDGKNLILAVEDENRIIRIDWLEMLHYREVLNNSCLFDSLNTSTYHRYGNSCRDISVRLSQDDFAIWSGFASKKIREIVTEKNASLNIFLRCDYEIKHISIDVSNIYKFKLFSWKIIFDDCLINKMSQFREKSLPNETGGVLLGNFDNEYEICYIIDIIPSPTDSEELPQSFIRGYKGLEDKVKNIEEKTLTQVRYIGEWHSHPDGYSVQPSDADLNTFLWLNSIMDKDSIPSIMMILGENKVINIMGAEPIIEVPTSLQS